MALILALPGAPARSDEAAAEAPAAAAPKPTSLVAEEPAASLGKVWRGNVAKHTFVLRNPGTEPVTISRILPACGCTVVDADGVIPPGGEGKVVAAVDTLMLGAGPGNTKVAVFTDDPENPLQLDLSYEVLDVLAAKPGQARWKSTQGEPEGTIGNTISSKDGKPFQVLGVEPPYPHVRGSFRPATDAERDPNREGPQWRVELTLDSHAPPGAITGHVTVRTDHPEQALIPIPISGFMRPTVYLFPEIGDLGAIEAARLPLRATFKYTDFATEPIAATAAEVDLPGVTATIEEVEKGREYRVAILLPKDMPPGPFAGTLTVHTDSEKAPTVTAAIKGTVVTAAANAGN